jgi:hypothetical protein
VSEPGDLALHKVVRIIQFKFEHYGIELGLHSKNRLREKKSTLYGELSKSHKNFGVK